MHKELVDKINSIIEIRPGIVYWVFIEEGDPEDVEEVHNRLNEYCPEARFVVSSNQFHVKKFTDIIN